MKKRIIALCLCICLLLAALPGSAHADSKLAFISLNDTLPPELINSFTYYGGTIYVPAWIFAAYGFGIYFSYVGDTGLATLYNASGTLNFNVSTGETYDEDGNQYTLSGILWGGSIYVPLSYVCSFFKTFNYSTINTQYGTILRIKDGRVVLTDTEFLKPAMNLLKQYYDAYNQDTEEDVQQPTPEPDRENNREGVDVLLSFAGLPGDDELALLEQYGIKGSFFVTADQIRSDADRVRRLACQGHRLGIMWQGDESSYLEAAALLFETARAASVLLASSAADEESCAAFAVENSLVYVLPTIEALYGPEDDTSPYVITSNIELSNVDEGISVLLNCEAGMAETLSIVLNYLSSNKFDIFSPSEIVH